MERSNRKEAFCGNTVCRSHLSFRHSVAQYITTKAERPWNQKRYLAVVKELPHRKKTIRQNQRTRLRYTHYNSRSAGRVCPQTHVLSFFTNDLSKSLRSAETYLYADDTTIFCIAETMDLLTNTLNNVLAELQEWCDRNLMVPHPEKCKAMIIQRQSTFTGLIQALRFGNKIHKVDKLRKTPWSISW